MSTDERPNDRTTPESGTGRRLGGPDPSHKLVGTLLTRKPGETSSTWALGSAAVVTFVTLIGWFNPVFGSLLPVSGQAVYSQGEWWRPWSACFAHADVGHLLSNLVLFVIFGRFLNGHFGKWLFPVWAFILGGLANLAVLPSYPPEVSVLGASGVVNVLGGLWLSLYFLISRQYRMTGRIVRTLGVALLLFAPQEFRPNVAERVHAAGLVAGLLFGIVWFFVFKLKIRSYEVWEENPPDDPEDELPPPEGIEVANNGEENFEQASNVDVEKSRIEAARDESRDGR